MVRGQRNSTSPKPIGNFTTKNARRTRAVSSLPPFLFWRAHRPLDKRRFQRSPGFELIAEDIATHDGSLSIWTRNVVDARLEALPTESVCAMDRWSLAETEPTWHRERSGSGLFVLPLDAAPDRRSFRRPDSPSPSVCLTSRLSRHSATCQSVDGRNRRTFRHLHLQVRRGFRTPRRLDVCSLSFRARTNGAFRARDFEFDVAAEQLALEPTNGRLFWDKALKNSTRWIRCGVAITGGLI